MLAIGVQVVGTVTGAAATPGPKALAELAGRYVDLRPDNDRVGRAHIERIGTALAGIAAAVSIIRWSDAPEHGDAADFIATGGTREDVEALVESAPPPPGVGSVPGAGVAEPTTMTPSSTLDADSIASSREVVTRTLHEMRADGLIKTGHDRLVVLLDATRLARELEAERPEAAG